VLARSRPGLGHPALGYSPVLGALPDPTRVGETHSFSTPWTHDPLLGIFGSHRSFRLRNRLQNRWIKGIDLHSTVRTCEYRRQLGTAATAWQRWVPRWVERYVLVSGGDKVRR
jgi:hypothetical protein